MRQFIALHRLEECHTLSGFGVDSWGVIAVKRVGIHRVRSAAETPISVLQVQSRLRLNLVMFLIRKALQSSTVTHVMPHRSS